MLSRILPTLKKATSSKLFNQVLIVGAVTVGVKIVAFSKELVVAYQFGVSGAVDAFVVVLMLHTILALVVGGAFHDAVIPDLAKIKLRSETSALNLLSNVVWLCAGILAATTLLLTAFGEQIVSVVGSGFSPEESDLGNRMLWLMLPFAVCFGTASILRGNLQANGHFIVSSGAQALVPLSIILILVVSPSPSQPNLLPIGASIGAILSLLLLVTATRRTAESKVFRRPGWNQETASVMRHAIPLLFGTAIMEACFFIDTAMAAALPEGSVAILNYGERICNMVLAVAGIAAGQVIFPHVSKLVATESWNELVGVTWRFCAICVLASLPLMGFFWIASEPVVRLLLERGEFVAQDTARVAEVLQFASLKIPGYILAVLGTRMILALKGNKFLLVSAVATLGLNILLNIWFIETFGVKGVSLSTAAVALFSSVMFFGYFAVKVRKKITDSESKT